MDLVQACRGTALHLPFLPLADGLSLHRRRLDPRPVHVRFVMDKLRLEQDFLRVLRFFSEATDGTMCPGVDSASKNEYQENSWG
jgi:hypothetical protein